MSFSSFFEAIESFIPDPVEKVEEETLDPVNPFELFLSMEGLAKSLKARSEFLHLNLNLLTNYLQYHETFFDVPKEAPQCDPKYLKFFNKLYKISAGRSGKSLLI